MKKIRLQEYEVYNHRILWIAARKNLAHSRAMEGDE